jgi:hypothetical protein
VLVRAWSGIGPLIGALIGSWLTRSWQRKQWLLESRKAEYRELMSVLSESANCILNNSQRLAVQGMGTIKSGEQERQSDEAATRGHRIIEDRIFMADTVAREKIDERWVVLLKEKDIRKFWEAWDELHRLLLKMAREDLNLKS